MSWKQTALNTIERWGIYFEDQSDTFMYRGTFVAPEGALLYESGTAVYTHVVERHKGSDKSKFWYQIDQIASTGVFSQEAYDEWLAETYEFDKQLEKE